MRKAGRGIGDSRKQEVERGVGGLGIREQNWAFVVVGLI
jgi:hypothetical protein